ncbi:hypothetical protein K488DRAFT_85218 [Vararia minispora EC-137]|uniref:Uncharacterized protein n=1 Tax=Vararia minispora EC-137 TaxID=1314806 RepID=A0ACB8QP02_9AGAM|nr:hypothetical protein K488DRAFT_85218 [Vararia minispora EC-137]
MHPILVPNSVTWLPIYIKHTLAIILVLADGAFGPACAHRRQRTTGVRRELPERAMGNIDLVGMFPWYINIRRGAILTFLPA